MSHIYLLKTVRPHAESQSMQPGTVHVGSTRDATRVCGGAGAPTCTSRAACTTNAAARRATSLAWSHPRMFCAEARPDSPCDWRCATIISAVTSRWLCSGPRVGGGCVGGSCDGGCGPAVHDCNARGSHAAPLSGASVGEPGCSKQGCPKLSGRPCFSHCAGVQQRSCTLCSLPEITCGPRTRFTIC